MADITPEETQPKPPACIGIILDGNRRWAKLHGLEPWQGHEAGVKKLKEATGWAIEAKVPNMVCYAFSTENWNRPQEEVDFLVRVITEALNTELGWLVEHNVRVRFLGDQSKFGKETQDALKLLQYRTESHKAITVALALNYGGRAEILRAVNKICAGRAADATPVTEAEFGAVLDTAGMPDHDMVIRTSGEQRLSGFLPWQTVYSELFFPSIMWPDMTKEIFIGMIEEFMRRQRRFGA